MDKGTKNYIIERELGGMCLMCGKDIWDLIYCDRPIHLHLCFRCREVIMTKLIDVRKTSKVEKEAKQ